eukprot:Gb_35343 [translate_table: standard]
MVFPRSSKNIYGEIVGPIHYSRKRILLDFKEVSIHYSHDKVCKGKDNIFAPHTSLTLPQDCSVRRNLVQSNATCRANFRVPPNPCSAWRLSMETNNLREWSAVPSHCETYVGKYMTLGQYLMDFKEVSKQSLA